MEANHQPRIEIYEVFFIENGGTSLMKKKYKQMIGFMLALIMCLSITPIQTSATEPTDEESPEDEYLIANDLSEIYHDIINVTMEEFCEMVISNTYINPSFNPTKGYLVADQFYIPPVAMRDPNVDYTVPHLCTHHATQPFFMAFMSGTLWHSFNGFADGNTGQEGRYTATIDGQTNVSFCATPEWQAMTSMTYNIRTTQSPNDNPLLAKILFYGYGGPSGENLWSYSTTHWMAAHAYPGSSFNGSSEYASQLAQANAKPLPPNEFTMIFYGVAGEWLVSDTGTNQQRQSFLTWYYDPPPPVGHLEIRKVSSNPTMSDGNPLYSLEGAVFNVFSHSTLLGTITTNAEGRGRLNDIDPSLTGLHIVEVQPPRGFALNNTIINFEIVADQTTTITVSNRPQNDPIGIMVRKRDADTNAPIPQGNAGLEGAEFTLRFYTGHFTTAAQLSGQTPVRTWVVRTDANGVAFLLSNYLVSGDPFYFAGNGDPTLPLGTLTIQESKPPEGYLVNNELFIRQITSTGWAESVFTFSTPIVPENVIRGGVEIEKWDIERNNSGLKQGDATLTGAVFEIINRSTNSVIVNGINYAPNAVVHTIKTNANGVAITTNNLLPYGRYEIREHTEPTGYLPTGIISRIFDITQNGVIVRLNTDNTAIKNDIIRGGVYVEKWDNEIVRRHAQGGATLEGAVFEIVNRSNDSVLVRGALFAPGEVVYTMKPTDINGATITSDYLLPYGTYEVREISPPYYGYLATGVLSRTFVIREHGVIVQLNTPETAIRNNPIRGDLRGVKIAEGNAYRLANVPFRITSVTTGENHVIVTDANGEFNTHSSWNPHSQNTNRGQTSLDGIWFGEISTLNDDLGALIFDRYIIEELRAEANEGFELLKFEVSIHRHMTVVDLGTLTDIRIPIPEISTTAMDRETTSNSAFVSEETVVIDTVYYSGFVSGREYIIKGVLMDKETEEPLHIDGKPVTAERSFRAFGAAGTVTVEFIFNSIGFEGKSIVVFQELYYNNTLVAEHTDIDCEFQTITFAAPRIKTLASCPDGNKVLDINSEVRIIDSVFYENLIKGERYTLRGILMDKETGEPLLIDGKTVTAESTFRAVETSGTVDVTFKFNSVSLIGKSVVVFQNLYWNNEVNYEHTDIDNVDQTVTFKIPKIMTLAHGVNKNKIIPIDKNAVIVDVVSYENLVPGQTYTLVGMLMDKETRKPLLVNGKEVVAQTTFTAKESSGRAEVIFTFDTTTLEGKTIVVYEYLYFEREIIAEHTDINDLDQTVTVFTKEPEPDKNTGTGAQTGQDGLPVWILIVGVGAFCGATGLIMYVRRKKNE